MAQSSRVAKLALLSVVAPSISVKDSKAQCLKRTSAAVLSVGDHSIAALTTASEVELLKVAGAKQNEPESASVNQQSEKQGTYASSKP